MNDDFSGIEINSDVLKLMESGNLFLFQRDRAQRQFQYLQNIIEVSKDSINNFSFNLSFLNELANIYNLKKSCIVFPSKPVIHSEELKKSNICIESIFMRYFSEFKGEVTYPIESLKKIHSTSLLDSHYNAVGCWIMTQVILNSFGIESSGDIPVFKYVDSGGDLSRMLGDSSLEVTSKFLGFEGDNADIKVFTNRPALQGNSGHICFYVNKNLPKGERLLVFGDSFSVQCLDMLSFYFRDLIYIRSSYPLEDVISCCKPHYVMLGIAERYLANQPNAKEAMPYFHRYFINNFDSGKLPDGFISAMVAMFSEPDSITFKRWFNNL